MKPTIAPRLAAACKVPVNLTLTVDAFCTKGFLKVVKKSVKKGEKWEVSQ
jgi:hypothetical protein